MGNGAGKIFKIMQKTGNENSSTSLVTLTVSSLNPLIFKLDNKLTITEEFYLLYYEDNTTFTLNQQVKALVLNNNQLYLILNKPNLTLDKIYPVGSIYIGVNSTSPATLFGGTWTQIEEKFLLGASSTYSAGSTGGSSSLYAQAISDNAELHIGTQSDVEWVSSYRGLLRGEGPGGFTVSNGIKVTGVQDNTNSLPPFLAVYMWKRTA